jgi:hypothetical protein
MPRKVKPAPVEGAASKASLLRGDDLKSVMLDTLGPVEPGLCVVAIRDPALLSMVRCAMERQIRLGHRAMGMAFPKKTPVLSLYAGSKRKAVEAEVLASAQRPSEHASEHLFRSMGTRDGFAWCTDEGLCALLPTIKDSRGWTTVAQVVGDEIDANIVDAFSRLRSAAAQARAFVMLFLVVSGRKSGIRIQDFTDNYVEVNRCEREPGAFVTFSANCVGLSDLHQLGIGSSMCSAKIEDGRYVWRWEQFISATVTDRVIWKLRCEGRSLAAIAKLVGLDKSNVHRHLAALPAPRNLELGREWFKAYADLLDLDETPTLSGADAGSESEKQDDLVD